MPMIRLRSGGWHHPAGTTGGPWRPLSVDQVLSRTCQASGHIAQCWLSQTARCRPQTRMVQWCHVWRWQPRQCTSQSVMAFADSSIPENVNLRVHVTWQQKMCLVRKPDIVKKVGHSVNLVAKPLARDHSLPLVVRCKFLFNLYPVRIHVEIYDQILRTDSRLIPSSWLRRRTDLLGLWTTGFLTAATLYGVLDDFRRPECDCLLVSLRLRLCTVPRVLNLLTHPQIIEWTWNSRHPNRSLNCNWTAWIEFFRKYTSTIP